MNTEIVEQFEDLGFDAPTGEILDKCVELCYEYDMSATDFVDQWIAFSVSNLNGSDPTISFLLEFERKELIPQKEKNSNSSTIKKKQSTTVIANSMHLLDSNQLQTYGVSIENDDLVEDDHLDNVVDTYCKTPKTPKQHVLRTPSSKHSENLLFNPVSYSPISTGTPRSSTKDNSDRKIVCTFGNSNLMQSSSSLTIKEQNEKLIIKQILTYNNVPMNSTCKYMFDNLMDKTLTVYDRLYDIGNEICKKHFGLNETNYELHNADIPNQDTFKTIGRIYCDFEENKLTKTSVILIGLPVNQIQDVQPIIVNLDLTKLRSYGLFPGQIVLVSGINPRGNTLFVEEIYTERILKSPKPPFLNNELKFIIASGPFTYNDDLLYEPLHDLISYCKENKPNILILVGPFMECDHSMINGIVLAETFDSFFEKFVSGIVEALGEDIKICMVSSHKDAISKCVYPTHPITINKNYSNVHMLPDPCIIEMNGLTIGATSTDIVKNLLEEELAFNAGDKIKRVVNYLFHQESFYPLDPPPINVCIDSDLASKYAKLEIIPNILILPSDHMYFIRDIERCLVINPGRLSGSKNSTFAKLVVSPFYSSTSNTSRTDEINPSTYMFGQITKI